MTEQLRSHYRKKLLYNFLVACGRNTSFTELRKQVFANKQETMDRYIEFAISRGYVRNEGTELYEIFRLNQKGVELKAFLEDVDLEGELDLRLLYPIGELGS